MWSECALCGIDTDRVKVVPVAGPSGKMYDAYEWVCEECDCELRTEKKMRL